MSQAASLAHIAKAMAGAARTSSAASNTGTSSQEDTVSDPRPDGAASTPGIDPHLEAVAALLMRLI